MTAGGAVVGAFDLAALTGVPLLAHTNSVGAGPLSVAALEAADLRTVVAGEAVLALTFTGVLTGAVPFAGTVV